MTIQPDITVENHGSIFLVRPQTLEGEGWLNVHIPEDAQWLGPAVAVEHRFIGDIVTGMINDGLEVQ